MKKIRTLLMGVTLGAFAPLAAQAFPGFYTGKADASLYNETSQVILVRDGHRTVMSILSDYKGPLKEFVMVVPTPTTLQRGQVGIADRQLFEKLDAWSSPRLEEFQDESPCHLDLSWPGERPPQAPPKNIRSTVVPVNPTLPRILQEDNRDPRLGVSIDSSYKLQEYDIVNLSATRADGLETWLRQNGYAIPKGTSAALKPYIQQGMKFFVAKVNVPELAKTGANRLRALQFAFESKSFVLPLRLGVLNAPADTVQDVIVYAITRNGRVESSNYRNARLPSNLNLPFFTKPRMQDVYQAIFDKRAREEQHPVVFTEYVWEMYSCEPCSGATLSTGERRAAGVFWVDGHADAQFRALRKPGGIPFDEPVAPPKPLWPMIDGPQPALLTRLHLRYSTDALPEDLMLTETRDQQEWQTRYAIQQPHASDVAACSAQMAQENCASLCESRVKDHLHWEQFARYSIEPIEPVQHAKALQNACVSSCTAAKQNGIETAARYYQQSLPERIRAEKQTLADLTGWSLEQIEQMPDAKKFAP